MEFVRIVEKLINENVKENANVLFSNNYVELQAQAIFQKEVAKIDIGQELMSMHENGDFHIHDLSFWLRPNCLQHPIYKVLRNGLYALGCISKPAKHLDTALSHCLNALSLGQAHMAGGQAIPMFNVWMAPYVKEVNNRELEQCIQQFIFQLNQISPSRGLQTIFASIGMNEVIPDTMKDMEVGYKDGVFANYEDEMYRFTEVFVKVLNEGDGVGRPFKFPNTIFYIKDGDVFSDELKSELLKNMMFNSNVYFLNGFKYGNELATAMGCVDGKEVIIYRFNGEIFVESFERMWKRFEKYGVKKYGISEYIEVDRLEIYDSRNGFVKVKRIIRNPDKGDWVEVKFYGGRSLLVTADHPLPTKEGVKRSDELSVGDVLFASNHKFWDNDCEFFVVEEIKFIGYRGEYSYDVETESGYFDVSGVYSHNCRTYLDDTKTGNMFKDVMGTGNMSYITLNIPRIVLEFVKQYGSSSESKLQEFVEGKIDELIEAGVKVLLARRNRLWKCWEDNWYPFFKNEVYRDENGWYYNLGYTTMAFGIVGISDCEKISDGKFDGLWFVKMLRSKIDELNEYVYEELAERLGVKYNNYGNEEVSRWSLIGSPAESCSNRFKMLDNKLYGDILKKVGIYDRKYYVNSIFVDDSENLNALEKVLREEKYHRYLNGGIICHIWNAISSEEIDELKIWDWFMKLMKKTDLRYVTVSNVICYCEDCCYRWVGSKFDSKCPKCDGGNIKKYAKITGYLSEVDMWNEGKVDEFYRRSEFRIIE